ncbi:hypothetical protein [Cupriavidus sp. TMH.W2]|uniref:hypothetical protein n=1 Tax=Cupriavidus sp. TMH.W2 TaxID=3434465 RepID=UPI003D76CC15
MSTDITMEQTGWEDPLPEHDTTRTVPAGAAAAPAHDAWGAAGTDWDAPAADASQAAAGAAVGAQASPVSPVSADAENGKRKRNANLLIAGIAVVFVGIVGTGVAVKMSRSKAAAEDFVAEPMVNSSPAGQSAHKAPSATTVATQQVAPQPDIQPSAEPVTAKSDLSPSPAGSIVPAPATAQSEPVAAAVTDAASLRELKAKDSALEATNTELKGQLAALTERVAALESKGQASSSGERQSEQTPRKVNAAHDAKAKQKLAYDADVVRGKPGANSSAKADPERASSWGSYHTVATYPATGKAEKAWVTNGKGLVVVTVGSEIDGVKVSRLAGTTVYLADGGKINVK